MKMYLNFNGIYKAFPSPAWGLVFYYVVDDTIIGYITFPSPTWGLFFYYIQQRNWR